MNPAQNPSKLPRGVKKLVAELAGVSKQTVSNVLYDKPNVAANTRLRVLQGLQKAKEKSSDTEQEINYLKHILAK